MYFVSPLIFYLCCVVLVLKVSGVKVIEEKCSSSCSCKREESSSKVQIALCSVGIQEGPLECSVEWPVLFLTVRRVQVDSSLLVACRRIRRLWISPRSALEVVRSDMFQYSADLEILVINGPVRTLESGLLRHLPSLKQMDLSSTRVEGVSRSIFEDCPISDTLRMASNQISSVEDGAFKTCVYLRKLDLSRNKMRKISLPTFEGVFNLETLDLSHNKIQGIEDLSFRGLRRLKILYLQGNLLRSLGRDTFGGLEALTHLRLESNNIVHVAKEAFQGLRNIVLINLRENKITTLDMVLFVGLSHLRLSFPELDCVQIREHDYHLSSLEVRTEFDKYPLCPGFSKILSNPPSKSDIQRLVQKDSKGPDIQSTPIMTPLGPPGHNSFMIVLHSHPYLIPMVLGGLSVALVSILVLSVVCHIKNKRINELRLQELQLPMMQSTL